MSCAQCQKDQCSEACFNEQQGCENRSAQVAADKAEQEQLLEALARVLKSTHGDLAAILRRGLLIAMRAERVETHYQEALQQNSELSEDVLNKKKVLYQQSLGIRDLEKRVEQAERERDEALMQSQTRA
jgi:hypothetical protein